MRILLIVLIVIPHFLLSQVVRSEIVGLEGCGCCGKTPNGFVSIDSFIVLDTVNVQPILLSNLDSNGIKDYPSLELYNEIKGSTYGYFRVDTAGKVDSAWIGSKISPGIDKHVLSILKYKLKFIPAQSGNRKTPCICRLSFNYAIKK